MKIPELNTEQWVDLLELVREEALAQDDNKEEEYWYAICDQLLLVSLH